LCRLHEHQSQLHTFFLQRLDIPPTPLLLLLLRVLLGLFIRDLYADASAEAAAADGDEPELRRQLRAARAAEKHAKMKAALAEQQAKEAAETERRQQQQAHKQAHKERIEAWRNKNKVRRGSSSSRIDGMFVVTLHRCAVSALRQLTLVLCWHRDNSLLCCVSVNKSAYGVRALQLGKTTSACRDLIPLEVVTALICAASSMVRTWLC
jgi:hypothetical protein